MKSELMVVNVNNFLVVVLHYCIMPAHQNKVSVES